MILQHLALCLLIAAGAENTPRMDFIIGSVQVERAGAARPAVVGEALADTDIIVTGKRSHATVRRGRDTFAITPERRVSAAAIYTAKQPEPESLLTLRRVFDRSRRVSFTHVASVRNAAMMMKGVEWGDDDDTRGNDSERVYAEMLQLVSKQSYEEALAHYGTYHDSFGGNAASALFAKGVAEFYLCRYADSEQTMTSLSAADDLALRADAYFYRAFSRHNRLDFAGSIQGFREYLASGTSSDKEPIALFLLGEAYRETGDAKNAKEQYQLIIKRYPDDPFATVAARQMKQMQP